MSNSDLVTTDYSKVIHDGLWNNNPALAQVLGLCPLLAVSGTVINSLALGVATMMVLIASNLAVSLLRLYIPNEIRIPVFVLIIAGFVTIVELLMHAYLYNLYTVLGIFVPLIVTNCAIIGRAEGFASKHSPLPSLVDGISMGLGFTGVLVALGVMREVLAQGTLFADASLMLGDWATTITLFENYDGFLLAALPPGAFIGLGFLLAFKNVIDQYMRKRRSSQVVVDIPDANTEPALSQSD
ncbi:MAG: electron transport complex subunit E [Arenicellales bacterium]|jgi:electron transport complex protein RnfE